MPLEIEKSISILSDPLSNLSELLDKISKAKSPVFCLLIAGTKTSDVEGISAAGATAADRRLTPKIDAEILINNRPSSDKSIPVSPSGIVSPVVISKAILNAINCSVRIIDCGAFSAPECEHESYGTIAAECLSSGAALDLEHTRNLFERGRELGYNLKKNHDLIIVAECVPGGTSTAHAILAAIYKSLPEFSSSSLPIPNAKLKSNLVAQGLANARITPQSSPDAFRFISCVGDPMQAVASGLALESASGVATILGGGTQMLAVHALAQMIMIKPPENLVVATTGWLANDSHANLALLAQTLGTPMISAKFDFANSRHQGLREYEKGHVKEGLGSGALLCLAPILDFDIYSKENLCRIIDNCYDELVLNKV
ncbi:MAG: TIGR00303 family protein [Candidatus Melainabacteria bacterium]|nr:TIGR00303 family protein [Candidatus Melainabacteria bacterium]